MKFPKGIRATQKPKMTNTNGRMWNRCPVILPDGSKIDGHYEITRSMYFYFEHDGCWYRGDIYDWDSQVFPNQITPDLRLEQK
jgi:hypothetical protein